jgi:hypothetical protein
MVRSPSLPAGGLEARDASSFNDFRSAAASLFGAVSRILGDGVATTFPAAENARAARRSLAPALPRERIADGWKAGPRIAKEEPLSRKERRDGLPGGSEKGERILVAGEGLELPTLGVGFLPGGLSRHLGGSQNEIQDQIVSGKSAGLSRLPATALPGLRTRDPASTSPEQGI